MLVSAVLAAAAIVPVAAWSKDDSGPAAPSAPSTPSAKPASPSAPAPNVMIADVTAWKDGKLTVKFRLDERFDNYVASRFRYPKNEGGLKNAKTGEVYPLTFSEDEAIRNVVSSRLLADGKAPAVLPDRSLVAKVVAHDAKTATIKWVNPADVHTFFDKEQTFAVRREGASHTPGYMIRVTCGPDNCDCTPGAAGIPRGEPQPGDADARERSGNLSRDLRLMWETRPLREPPDPAYGPNPRCSTDRAINPASRVFNTVELIGKSRDEIVALLGDPKSSSDSMYNFPFWQAPKGSLVYRFDNGACGWQFNVLLGDDGRAREVQRLWIH
jgi:hypothetical protein